MENKFMKLLMKPAAANVANIIRMFIQKWVPDDVVYEAHNDLMVIWTFWNQYLERIADFVYFRNNDGLYRTLNFESCLKSYQKNHITFKVRDLQSMASQIARILLESENFHVYQSYALNSDWSFYIMPKDKFYNKEINTSFVTEGTYHNLHDGTIEYFNMLNALVSYSYKELAPYFDDSLYNYYDSLYE